MGQEGLAVLLTIARLSAPVPLDAMHLDDKPLVLELRGEEPPAKPLLDLQLELRDNTMPGEWSRQVDYEIATTRGAFCLALNHHFIVRNMSEAQVVASYTIQY